MDVVLNDLMIHRQERHVSCIAVNTWTRFNGTYENIFMIVVEKSFIDFERYIDLERRRDRSGGAYLSKEHVVGLVLDRHKHDEYSIEEL